MVNCIKYCLTFRGLCDILGYSHLTGMYLEVGYLKSKSCVEQVGHPGIASPLLEVGNKHRKMRSVLS